VEGKSDNDKGKDNEVQMEHVDLRDIIKRWKLWIIFIEEGEEVQIEGIENSIK
jgi:hypothetical protein